MSKFFIDRPIFAWVIALVIMLAGGLSILKLPINQYPSIAAPAVAIQVSYPGASAQTVQDTVVQVIEQQLNGIDGLRYIASESNSDGSMTITATFEQGTNPDIAQVQVQNKLQLATPLLPQEVQQQGIRVTKAVKNFLLVIGVVSEDGSMDKNDLANYIVSNMQDPISRTKGVGDFQVFGAQYAMRIWLDPAKLNNYQLTPVDVKTAIQAQNVQISSGQLGGLPASPASSSTPPSSARPACRPPSSSARSSSRSTATAPRCACVTSPPWSWAARTTASAPSSTATPPPAWPSSWPPAPTRWTPPRPSARPSPSWSRSSRRA